MRWNIDPVAFTLGGFELRWYGFFFFLAVLLAFVRLRRVLPQYGLTIAHAYEMALVCYLGMVVGAHVVDVVFYHWDELLDDPGRLLDPRHGLSSHGAAIGVVLGTIAYARWKGHDVHRLMDATLVALIWSSTFVRTGNFFNSEIVGTPTDLPWGVIFEAAGYAEPRHPVQLYEVLQVIGLGSIAEYLHRRRAQLRSGVIFYAVISTWLLTRFGLEWFKARQVDALPGPLSMGQLLSAVGLVLCSLASWWRFIRRGDGRVYRSSRT